MFDRSFYQFSQDINFDVFHLFDIYTGFSGCMFSEVLQQVLLAVKIGDIKRKLRFPGRKACQGSVSFMAAVIYIMVGSKTDNAGPPHFCLKTGLLLKY